MSLYSKTETFIVLGGCSSGRTVRCRNMVRGCCALAGYIGGEVLQVRRPVGASERGRYLLYCCGGGAISCEAQSQLVFELGTIGVEVLFMPKAR